MRKKPRLAIAVLAVSHGLVLLAGFFAPYDSAAQYRELPFAPPTHIHFLDSRNKLHLRPFVYRWRMNTGDEGGYHEDRSVTYAVRFFSRGHFFGTDRPAKIFLLGSDAYGRDQFSRFLYGGRISLFAGLLATAVSLGLGMMLGGAAGFYGRWLDELIMRAAEIFLALPWLYLLFAVRAFLPLHIDPNGVFLLLLLVLGAIGWARPARLIRGIVLSAKERDYVLAARGFGASDIYLLRRHVLPQAWSVVLAQAAVLIPAYVLAEIVLSFFGLGVSEPAPSWGNLLANLRQYNVLESYWWMFLPALALIPVFLAYYHVFSYYGSVPPRGAGIAEFEMKRAKPAKWLAGSGLTAILLGTLVVSAASRLSPAENEQFLVTHGEIGRSGGRLVISQRAEPKTLNPLIAADGSSREIIGLIMADLIHINRSSQRTEAALANSWTASRDGREYTLQLRRGLKFSDGQPFDAADVLFTFQVYLDERVHAPQRDLLIVGGKPIQVQKVDGYTVLFKLAQPYAAAERLFDSIAILPRHLLQKAYEQGQLTKAWTLTTPPGQIAGLGPFRIKAYLPGQHIVLERNPYYWKKDAAGNRLPYLDEIVSVFTGNADAEAMRFERGEVDVVGRLSAENFAVLKKHQRGGGFRLYDLGPGFEYNFLFFNLNDLGASSLRSIAGKQIWFRQLAFRKAVSAAIDREAINRLAYHGRARPLSTFVTPGNKLWVNRSIPQLSRSIAQARKFLRNAGFSWTSDGRLLDDGRRPVTFSVIFNAGNPQHTHAATLIQSDLEQLGMEVKVVPLEFRALLNRIFKSYEYDAAILQLASGDADPNSEINVWTSDGGAHVWNLGTKRVRMPWEEEVDRLMRQQMITLDYERRKRMYDRVQQLVWENLPLICLVSPDVLAGATERLGNFHPAILSNYTLWNVEELSLSR